MLGTPKIVQITVFDNQHAIVDCPFPSIQKHKEFRLIKARNPSNAFNPSRRQAKRGNDLVEKFFVDSP